MKLEVGMYIRTKYGIAKFINLSKNKQWYILDKKIVYDNIEDWEDIVSENEIEKASYNIVDLIKPKDILLGKDGKIYQCQKIYKDYVFTYSKNEQGLTITLVDYQIDKILTHEQFEREAYKV